MAGATPASDARLGLSPGGSGPASASLGRVGLSSTFHQPRAIVRWVRWRFYVLLETPSKPLSTHNLPAPSQAARNMHPHAVNMQLSNDEVVNTFPIPTQADFARA